MILPGCATSTPESASENPAKVLILGDSISIGYTPYVQEMLKGEAVVVRPTFEDGKPENCAGTAKGLERIEAWLAMEGGNWDVIHFNWGLHDLKRVHAETGENSVNPDDPRQAEPEAYEAQLRWLVDTLKASSAALIFATTTPVPEGKVNPHRAPKDVEIYNGIAKTIMKENKIAVNDLYAFALPRLSEIQRPVNVHFTDEGSGALGEEVARHIREAMKQR